MPAIAGLACNLAHPPPWYFQQMEGHLVLLPACSTQLAVSQALTKLVRPVRWIWEWQAHAIWGVMRPRVYHNPFETSESLSS